MSKDKEKIDASKYSIFEDEEGNYIGVPKDDSEYIIYGKSK